MNTASPSLRRTGSLSERARQEPPSTYIICSALGCRCSRCTFPGGSSEESKIIPRAPASAPLMMFLTIKPSWSGLVITCPATSRTFLISTVLLHQLRRHVRTFFGTGRSVHDEQHPTCHLAARDPRVGHSCLL